MHGEPALPDGFSHFAYANASAPKGGRMVQGVLGTFDSLNPFIVRGLPPQAWRAPLIPPNALSGTVIESLMVRGYDEPFTLYGLLARTVETDDSRSYVTFGINPAARFSDGKPVTAADVLFSWQLFRDKGRPNQRTYYRKVVKAEALDELTVRFDFGGSEDRELPLILGLMSVVPKHAVNPDTFEETTLKPMIGSGPYAVAGVDAGKSLTLEAQSRLLGPRPLPVNRGFWNFDEIRFEYYRDANSYHEAFKAGLFDVRPENDPGRWQTAYNFPALREGRVVKEAFQSGLPKPNVFFVFNTRRAIFSDIRVREALSLLFDFEWINHNIFFDVYRRSGGFFAGSELSARGVPADERERALLAPYPDAVRADVLAGTWTPPNSDGSGRDRTLTRRALALFAEAGYELRSSVLVNKASSAAFAFEIMVTTRDEERLALLFADQLKRAGIAASVRVVDAVQYETRRISYDFDMIQNRMDQSLSPGNEQAFYWSTAAAESQGTRNYMGIKSPAADAMIAALLTAKTRPEVVSAVRALDRVLISGFYVVPGFYVPDQWIAHRTTLARPATTSLHGPVPETWWRSP